MIAKLYAVLIKNKNGEETIFAMTGILMSMQAVTSNKGLALKVLAVAQKELPEADIQIVEFTRAE